MFRAPRPLALALATSRFEMQWFSYRRKHSREEMALRFRRMLWDRIFALILIEAAHCKDRRRRE
jgi:hypothetical protein